ncbi:hypothetical protein Tco_0320864 [Tanacetum coccineum]
MEDPQGEYFFNDSRCFRVLTEKTWGTRTLGNGQNKACAANTLALICCSTAAAVIGAAAALAVVAETEVPESVLEPLSTIPVVMKLVQSMSSSVTPVRQYGNPASGYESYMTIELNPTECAQASRETRAS